MGTGYTRRSGFEVIGRDGVTLSGKWAGGVSTLHGFQSNGFPNCFFMGLVQGGFTANFTHMLNEQSIHIAYIVNHATETEARTVEATEQAEEEWVATIGRLALNNQKFQAECTPGYYNNEGMPEPGVGFTAGQYGGGPVEFFRLMSEWRAEGGLAGLAFA